MRNNHFRILSTIELVIEIRAQIQPFANIRFSIFRSKALNQV